MASQPSSYQHPNSRLPYQARSVSNQSYSGICGYQRQFGGCHVMDEAMNNDGTFHQDYRSYMALTVDIPYITRFGDIAGHDDLLSL